jgi:hypothetical protein
MWGVGGFSSINEEERRITNGGFWIYPISPKFFVQCIVPILVVFLHCPLNNLDQILIF